MHPSALPLVFGVRGRVAYVTATVTVWDADPRIADEKLRLVEKIVQGRDFTAMPESVNAVDAWLGSLPGHAYGYNQYSSKRLSTVGTLSETAKGDFGGNQYSAKLDGG
jgi:Type IV secretory pathway, VirB4 components